MFFIHSDDSEALIIIGIKDVNGNGLWQNQDMIKTVVPDDLQLDPVTDNLCLAIKITSDADDTTANVVTQEVISCDKAATTTHYMCRFNYIAQTFKAEVEADGTGYDEAQSICKAQGGWLATFTDNDQLTKVKNNILPDIP